MLPDTLLDNGLRSPNNNTELPRTRGSLCLSPVTHNVVQVDNKRRSWCGTPSNFQQTSLQSKRYGELGQFKPRSDAFLEPYFQGLGDRQSPGVGAPSTPSPPPQPSRMSSSRSISRESLMSSNGGGSEASSEDSDGYGATCELSLMERLVLSHPIWFLPGIQRAGAFHLLQGKEEGCFVVRKSSQSDTMALSVRLPPDKGPYIEHYLIHSSEGQLGLETSENRFIDMAGLIAHYASCCDELPVRLELPKAIRDSKSRQQLSSYALLGQEFWRYSPPPSAASSPDADLVLNLNPLMSTFKTAEPSTPAKPARPNTLNLLSKFDVKNEDKPLVLSKTPPPPPPRWSKPTTPNNFTVTTTVTFSVNAQSPNETDPKRMSPEGCTSTTSSTRGSLRRAPTSTITSPTSDTLSPLSPLSANKTIRHSKRTKQKPSKHYQESDIVDSPTMLYYKSGLGDKISDYEDVWTNNLEGSNPKPKTLASPDLLQHTEANRSLANTPTTTGVPKQGSPFYAEPADSLSQLSVNKRQHTRPAPAIPQHRHSNPPPNFNKKSMEVEGVVEPILLARSAASVDNLSPKAKVLAKPVVPPLVSKRNDWTIDNSWKFMGDNLETSMESTSDGDYDSDLMMTSFPHFASTPLQPCLADPDGRTTLDLISKRFPDIRTSSDLVVDSVTSPSTNLATDEERCRMSAYDNVEERRVPRPPPSEISELTEFSDPWTEVGQGYNRVTQTETDDSDVIHENPSNLASLLGPPAPVPTTRLASINRSKSFKERLDPLLSAPRLQALRRREPQSGPRAVGEAIRAYALELAQDKDTTFAQNVDNFIACTCDSKETNPQVVMRNMRQFMSGMKNYLVKHGEKEFYKEIERERNKLKSTEFLNLDAILEGVMHKLVVKPLKNHLQKLFLDYYTKTGAIRLLADNIQYASTRSTAELAIKSKINLPSDSVMSKISEYLQSLQNSDSPLEKLEYLLAAIAVIFNSVKTGQLTGSGRLVQLGADDFLPLFVWVLVKTNFVAAEIEAEYMWGLLHPSLLSGEGGYYLTTLSSAIHVLKNFKDSCEETNIKNTKNDSVLKVVVPDELHGSILTKTLPARPQMTTKEVCKIIAHKARITNPQDYALYRLTDGEETMLMDNECPQDFINKTGKHTMLAYKRIDAKIAWPKQDKLNI